LTKSSLPVVPQTKRSTAFRFLEHQ